MCPCDRIGKDRSELSQVLGICYPLLVDFLDYGVDYRWDQQLLADSHKLPSPCNRSTRVTKCSETAGKLKDVDKFIELTDGHAKDIGGTGAANKVDEPVRDHLLLSGVPFFSLAMDIDPNSKPFVFRQGSIRHFRWNSPILFLSSLNEDL
ncbi:hypothetical protein GRAN_4735 [Granulicella sibirica]|uniref:Uncharacterized protein n=1 Tax=Granulicella sibirica TaxID=2479048 RepID=A0A4Q0SY71_9BACT|nr:hypothetical protein GRAN_4735 [Granulicella sibirica]